MIFMINGYFAVERNDQVGKDKAKILGENPFLTSMTVSNNFGKIAFLQKSEDGAILHAGVGALKVGMNVYFGNKYEKIVMDGRELLIMDRDNIFSVAIEG